MCLHTNESKPRVAKKDIICYKLVEAVATSPIQQFITPDRKILKGRPVILKPQYRGRKQTKYYINTIHTVSRFSTGAQGITRGIHSYAKLSDARRRHASHILLRCIIPQGTLYYTGTVNGEEKGYASLQIYIDSSIAKR